MILVRLDQIPRFLRVSSHLTSGLTAFILSLFIAPHDLVAVNHSPVLTLFLTSSSTTSAQAPYAFPLSESELRDLAKALAPRVDLFREVWEKDPEAEFFAGTTRDFLYWILGHFKGLENLESSAADPNVLNKRREKIAKIKAQLLAIPFIKFNEIVGPESDADIMTKNREALRSLRAEDFAIRKLDFISFDRALPGQKMYQDEINQGYIPSEKIRLSKKGIVTDSNFGNGVSDLISGNLSIQFPDREKFWNTHYAKHGANHPLLLALRYVRILSQDYLQRHGSEIPDPKKLEAPMAQEIKSKIKALIQEAITDFSHSFRNLLQNHHGKKWLNASIQKSFRSFTNANAAFELMKELGLLGLIEVYPEQIESVHQYLLKTKRNESEIAENFKKFGMSPEDLYENIESYLPDRELYHGTASELAFRNIIYQGVIPSEGGSAGRGLYGVSKTDLEFAKDWSNKKSSQTDIVIALKLKLHTRIVDITKGSGLFLFQRWKQADLAMKENGIDSFAQAFGIDLIRYPYTDSGGKEIEAFVLKNSQTIESRRGVFKNPRPLSGLISEAIANREKINFPFLKDVLESPLTQDERNKIFSILGEDYFVKLLESQDFRALMALLNLQVAFLLDFLLHSPFTATHPLVLNLVPSLLKDPNQNIRLIVTRALQGQTSWSDSFWNEVPALLKDPDLEVQAATISGLMNQTSWPVSYTVYKTMAIVLSDQHSWPAHIWSRLVPTILKNSTDFTRPFILSGLVRQRSWPDSFWNEVPSLLKYFDSKVQSSIVSVLQTQTSWPDLFWRKVREILEYPDASVRLNMTRALQTQTSWPQSVWDQVPTLLKNPDKDVQSTIVSVLQTQASWPQSVWDQVPALLKNPDKNIISVTLSSLQTQAFWPQSVWDQVPALLKNPDKNIISAIVSALQKRISWPNAFWNEVPTLFKDPDWQVRSNINLALQKRTSWSDSFWNEVPTLLKYPDANVQWNMTQALRTQTSWPQPVWNEVPALLKNSDKYIRSSMTLSFTSQTSWPSPVWNLVPALLKDSNQDVRSTMNAALQKQSSWPPSFWAEVPTLLQDIDWEVRWRMNYNLQYQDAWPISVWNLVPSISKDPNGNVRLYLAMAISTQKSWTQETIDLIAQSTDPVFGDLRRRKPKVLNLSSCPSSLTEIKDSQLQNNTHGEVKP